MRWLIAALALCLGASVLGALPVTSVLSAGMWLVKDQRRVYQIDVEATGRTAEEARTEAFRLAVDQAVGSLLLAETEVSNGDLKRRDIVVYASGYVDKFEILSQENTSDGVKLRIRVWVSHSQIANRLLSKSETKGDIDGNRASVQIGSIDRERANGDRAVELVLRDFPGRAFDVELGQTNFVYGANRGTILEIPFTIKWSYNYLAALNEVLQKTSQNPDAVLCRSNCPHSRYIRIQSPKDGARFVTLSGYNDYQKFDMVLSELVGSGPKLLLAIKNDMDRTVSEQCYNMPELDHVINFNVPTSYMVDVLPNLLRINGEKVIRSKFVMPIQNIGTLSRAELKIVRGNQCPSKS